RCGCTSTACARWSTSRSRCPTSRPVTASATASPLPMAATDGAALPRRSRRFRRRLRTRIILSFLLLGTGLTALFAFLTDYSRQRVESQLVEDVMNKNIDEFARLYA